MSVPATAVRNGQGNQPAPFVVIPHAHGYTVYAADAPSDAHQVSGSPDNPSCTCPDFRAHPPQLRYRCPHIHTVFRDIGNGGTVMPVAPPDTRQETAGSRVPVGVSDGIGMILKRSVSPDGRIDSLSVELTIPPEVLADRDIDEVAMAVLNRQDAIVTAFLDSRRPEPSIPSTQPSQSTNGPVQAVLRDVGGMQTRWGWRYFINVETGGKMYKLFGTRKQLAEHLVAAGYAQYASQLNKGFHFNASCLAVLAPSEDGKYTNVESLLPPSSAGGNGR